MKISTRIALVLCISFEHPSYGGFYLSCYRLFDSLSGRKAQSLAALLEHNHLPKLTEEEWKILNQLRERGDYPIQAYNAMLLVSSESRQSVLLKTHMTLRLLNDRELVDMTQGPGRLGLVYRLNDKGRQCLYWREIHTLLQPFRSSRQIIRLISEIDVKPHLSLADITSLSKTTIQKWSIRLILKELVKKGWIKERLVRDEQQNVERIYSLTFHGQQAFRVWKEIAPLTPNKN